MNQGLLAVGDDAGTERLMELVNAGGEAFLTGTTYAGRRAIRVSVCSWQSNALDAARCVAAMRAALGGS